LQQRTDAMKETSDAKQLVYGASSSEQYLNLDSKPPVYHSAPSSASQLQQYMSLDLTSGMMAAGESTSSTPQLPRPGTKIEMFLLLLIIS
jgi:hypothetical protein